MQQDPNQVLLVADLQGSVVGMACFALSYYLPLGAATCRITALAVAEGMQRKGIGRALLREAERQAREGGAVRIELTSAQSRTQAHEFYRECGYRDGRASLHHKRLGDA